MLDTEIVQQKMEIWTQDYLCCCYLPFHWQKTIGSKRVKEAEGKGGLGRKKNQNNNYFSVMWIVLKNVPVAKAVLLSGLWGKNDIVRSW